MLNIEGLTSEMRGILTVAFIAVAIFGVLKIWNGKIGQALGMAAICLMLAAISNLGAVADRGAAILTFFIPALGR